MIKKLTVINIMEDVPDEKALSLADALLFSVYGWNPEKVSKMSITSIMRWVGYAKKRMTWKDVYKLRKLLDYKPKRVSLWKKILKRKY